MTLSQIPFRSAQGEETSLSKYQGQVLLIVNVASQCGLTPQYEVLERIFEKYKSQGFTVLAFPANEFGAQEPGTNAEIQDFCRGTFGVQFPVFEKIVVKGAGQHALYKQLTESKPAAVKNPNGQLAESLKKHGLLSGTPEEIMWNFEKFLVNRKGEVVQRFAPDITPDDPTLISAIEKELAAK
ncbi:MAG: glutathione peroxidase [Bdellovibrio sp.]|nr:glutathione peroxidase [Bdellovibrio sp.]